MVPGKIQPETAWYGGKVLRGAIWYPVVGNVINMGVLSFQVIILTSC